MTRLPWIMAVIPGLALQVVFTSSVVPVAQEDPSLQSLLHLALSHSNLTLLREMAVNGTRLADFELDSIDELESDIAPLTFSDVVRMTIINKQWTTIEQFIDAIEDLSDYGDRLMDKAAVLDSVGGLDALVLWMLDSDVATSISSSFPVLTRVNAFFVEISQNRDNTKSLVLSRYPEFVPRIFAKVSSSCLQTNDWISDTDLDRLCASYVSVMTAMLTNTPVLVKSIDASVMVLLAAAFSRLPVTSISFMYARLITLFNSIAQTGDANNLWSKSIDTEHLLSHVGEALPLSLGAKLFAFMKGFPLVNISSFHLAADRIRAQCQRERGMDEEWCDEFSVTRQFRSDEL